MKKYLVQISLLLTLACNYKIIDHTGTYLPTVAIVLKKKPQKISHIYEILWTKLQQRIIKSSGLKLASPQSADIHIIIEVLEDLSIQESSTKQPEKQKRVATTPSKITEFNNTNKANHHAINETRNYRIDITLWDTKRKKTINKRSYTKVNTHSIFSKSIASTRMISNLDKIKESQKYFSEDIGYSISNDLQNELIKY